MSGNFLWGAYEPLNLLGLAIQSIFVENFVLSIFLGMCSFLSCSTKVKTANGLGLAVVFVITCAGMINWFVRRFITAPGALAWLSCLGYDFSWIDLSFLELLLFITVIAAFTQMTEIVVENTSQTLYRALGIFLPLIAVNCAVLGVSLFMVIRDYPLIPAFIYVLCSSVGWWFAIVLMAAIREKLLYSKVPKGLEGVGITFITGGLMAMAFMGFAGMNFAQVTGSTKGSRANALHTNIAAHKSDLASQ
jgi:Na+-transporting NADH:ubiquinone oxidoreductase subunit E